MADNSFRGTLLLLQNKTKRDPDSYREEYLMQLDHFYALVESLLSSSVSKSAELSASNRRQVVNPQLIAVMQYVCSAAYCFPAETSKLAPRLTELLKSAKDRLDSETRLAVVTCLMQLRNKDLVSAELTLPLFFELLLVHDKPLRQAILAHIVMDIKRIHQPPTPNRKESKNRHIKNVSEVSKKVQNFLFEVMADDDPIQSRCSLMILVELYRRQIWVNERCVQVISSACFSKHSRIIRMALRFFLLQMPKMTAWHDDSDSEEEGPKGDVGRSVSKMKQKLKVKAKTRKRERILERDVKKRMKRADPNSVRAEEEAKQYPDPLRLVRDPHLFAENLLSKLQKTTERFDVRILYLSVIARAVAEHEVVLLPLYSFLERYMEPTQLHAPKLLAIAAACVHRMVPPEAVEGLLRAIANHFVNDRSEPDTITIGLNTIREICKRQPLAMTPTLLSDLAEYKSQRGSRGVMMAARSLIQLFRRVQPDLLPTKLRGSKKGAPETIQPLHFGAPSPLRDIPGMELLLDAEADESAVAAPPPAREQRKKADDEFASTSSSDDEDGEWEEMEDEEAESEGGWEDVKDAESAKNNDGQEAVQQPAKKRRGVEDDKGIKSAVDAGEEEEGEEADESGDEWEEVEEGDEEDSSDEEEEADEEGHADGDVAPPLVAVDRAAKAEEGGEEWFEEARPKSGDSVAEPKDSSTSIAGAARLLTDEDFARIRTLQARAANSSTKRPQKKRDAEREAKRETLMTDTGALDSSKIEAFTGRKRDQDRKERIDEAIAARSLRDPFNIRKRKKNVLIATNTEKAKHGKLYQMAKHSARVGTKLKRSTRDRNDQRKKMRKKNTKFRIKRGWKA